MTAVIRKQAGMPKPVYLEPGNDEVLRLAEVDLFVFAVTCGGGHHHGRRARGLHRAYNRLLSL